MVYSENIRRLEELTPKMYDADILFNIFRYANDLIAVVNQNGYFVYLNDKWEDVLGFTIQEMTNQPIVEFVHPDDVQTTKLLLSKLANNHESIEAFTNRYRRKDKGYVSLCWSSSAFVDGLCYAIARKCPLTTI